MKVFKYISILIPILCLLCLSCNKKENEFLENKKSNLIIKNETDYIFKIQDIDRVSDDKNIFLLNMKIDYVRRIEKLDEKYDQKTIIEAKYFIITSSEIKPNEELSIDIETNDKIDENSKIAFFIFQDDGNTEMKYPEYCNIMIQHGFIVLIDYEDFISGEITIRKDNIFKVTELAYEDFEEYKEILLQNPEKLIPVDSDFMKK